MKTEYFLSCFHLAGKPFATEQYLDAHLSYSARELMAWVLPAILGLHEPLKQSSTEKDPFAATSHRPQEGGQTGSAFPPLRQR